MGIPIWPLHVITNEWSVAAVSGPSIPPGPERAVPVWAFSDSSSPAYLMGRRGGKSARQSRARDAIRHACNETFTEHCAPQYAQQLLDGGVTTAEGIRSVDVAWVAANTSLPSSVRNVVCECVWDARQSLALMAGGSAVENLAPGVKASQSVDQPSHSEVKVAAPSACLSTAQRGTDGSQAEGNVSLEDNQIAVRFLQLLDGLQGVRRLVAGYELQWEAAVATALQDLKSEFEITDIVQRFDGLCKMGQTLFLRELKGKAIRIVAYKKRMKKKKQVM